MTPRFQLARLNSRVSWGHWEAARFGGDKIVSLSQETLSLRNFCDIPGEASSGRWDLQAGGGVSHHTAELREILWGENMRREQEEAWGWPARGGKASRRCWKAAG